MIHMIHGTHTIHAIRSRRAAAVALLATLSTGALAETSAPAPLTARGVVFADHNADLTRQPDEPGLPGVAVSNGLDVVLTDHRGAYEIPIDPHDATIFVIKPRDFAAPTDAANLPRFYYTHKPEGSPDEGFHFKGVAPTGDLPRSIDFPLIPAPESDRFAVLVFADPQPYTLEQIAFFRREVVDPVIGRHDIAFGMSLGDLVGDQLELFTPLIEAKALFGVPWRNVYGNHDMNAMSGSTSATSADPDRYADETFERVFGPPTYAFQHAKVHFIILDNVIWQGFDGFRERTPDNWPAPQMPDVSNYRGGLRPEQITFIENYLRHVPTDHLVVLAFHIPIEGGGRHRIPEQDELFRVLSTHPNTFSLSGHTHVQRHWFFGAEHGYAPSRPGPLNAVDPARFAAPVHHHLNAATASGSWYNGWRDEEGLPHTTMRCGAPNGYTLVHFDGARYRTEFKPARRPESHQMTIDAPDAVDPREHDELRVLANVFHGAEGDPVAARIVPAAGAAPKDWIELTFDPQIDPLYQAAREREQRLPEELVENWGLPAPLDSPHIWTGAVPLRDLPPGTHVLEIRHRDLYGHERVARRTFRILDAR